MTMFAVVECACDTDRKIIFDETSQNWINSFWSSAIMVYCNQTPIDDDAFLKNVVWLGCDACPQTPPTKNPTECVHKDGVLNNHG
ncbi:hypothetical protein L596_028712 [Steinernema carpocapsae]|uniref:Uncharacterized protein n=1 Tax=Steinernema carpocapsae TaxID=34508 RepID=A0A4U5LZA4_STECR|nr:hypothetical protein L596_028712 [Steinernema carpocapsae]